MYVDTSIGTAIIDIRNKLLDRLTNEQVIIVGSSGSGKDMLVENYIYLLWLNGYTIISLTDVKDKYELAYAQFKPKEEYHLEKLRKWGITPTTIPVEIYHPFTFNIEKNRKYPKTNLFTFNIKNLTRDELNYIAETDTDKTSLKMLLDQIQKLKPNEGLHHLIYKTQKLTQGQENQYKGTKLYSENPDDFFAIGAVAGTEKNVNEIIGYFKQYQNDYILAPANCPLNINIKKIINQQDRYHMISTEHIKDKKTKSFIILQILNEIVRHHKDAKHPICLYINEVRFVTPDKTEGYTTYLSQAVKNQQSIIRSMGKGMTSIMSTQVWSDVDEAVRNSATQTIYGRLSITDTEKLSKALRWSTTQIKQIGELEIGQFINPKMIGAYGEQTFDKFTPFLPPHRHAEETYSYEETLKKEKPEDLIDYNSEIEIMKRIRKNIEQDVLQIIQKEKEEKKKKTTEEQQRKQQRTTEKIKQEYQKMTNIKEKADTIIQEQKEKIWQDYNDYYLTKQKTLAQIATEHKIILSNGSPDKTKIIRIYQEIQKTKNNTNDTKTNEDETQ